MKPEFSEPIFTLKKGETSEPIMTPDGCFLLFVEDRKYAGIQPLDQERDQIERILITQMTQNNMEHWLEAPAARGITSSTTAQRGLCRPPYETVAERASVSERCTKTLAVSAPIQPRIR